MRDSIASFPRLSGDLGSEALSPAHTLRVESGISRSLPLPALQVRAKRSPFAFPIQGAEEGRKRGKLQLSQRPHSPDAISRGKPGSLSPTPLRESSCLLSANRAALAQKADERRRERRGRKKKKKKPGRRPGRAREGAAYLLYLCGLYLGWRSPEEKCPNISPVPLGLPGTARR